MSRKMDRIEERFSATFYGDNTRREEIFEQMKQPLRPEEIPIKIEGEETASVFGEASGC